jgi:endonuclease-8
VPEGDTIWRAARTLHRALAGQSVVAARSSVPAVDEAALAGRTVEAVESRGKNLLIRLDDGRVLHTHMRMTGSWHVYRPGEPWQRPERQARVVLETARYVAVCFNAPVVELLAPGAERRHPALSRLGPDLLSPGFDRDEARRRLRARGDLPVGEALLAQDALAGIGNVYKSETLFLCGIDPFRPVRDLSDADLDRVVERARTLMSANLGGTPRATRARGGGFERMWVYRRRGRPCRRCGTPIRMRRQGTDARSTYFCPRCQAGSDSERSGGDARSSRSRASDSIGRARWKP